MQSKTDRAQPIHLLLTPTEAAMALGISRAKLYPLLMGGQIPSIRIGGSRRVSIAALERFIEQQVASDPFPAEPFSTSQHGE